MVYQRRTQSVLAVFYLANQNNVIAFVIDVAVKALKPGRTRLIEPWRAVGALNKRLPCKTLGRCAASKTFGQIKLTGGQHLDGIALAGFKCL